MDVGAYGMQAVGTEQKATSCVRLSKRTVDQVDLITTQQRAYTSGCLAAFDAGVSRVKRSVQGLFDGPSEPSRIVFSNPEGFTSKFIGGRPIRCETD